ncbi:MAG: VOC family protein, partial [Rhodoglobus sp.]
GFVAGDHVTIVSRMTNFPGPITAITLFVDDLPAAREFYLRAFELPVHWEDENSAVFTFGDTMINLLASTEATELIEPRAVAPESAGSRMQLTLTVDDVDATAAALVARGVALLNGPMDRPWGIRTAAFADPAGHVWEIAS